MSTAILIAALTIFRVDPFSHVPILPDKDPFGGKVVDSLSVAAAKGEIEPVSFVVSPDRDIPQVDVVVSELSGADGAKIPADAADVASVKVWFFPAGRWMTTWRGDQNKPMPLNTLVLRDDGLIRVDWTNKVNYLRIDYADGPTYVNISQKTRDPGWNYSLQPVKDAAKFVPFDLTAGFRQQYLVTWRVPKDAKPGKYDGTVSLVSRPKGGSPTVVAKLPLSFRVYPFTLPRARTHYDLKKPYVSFWMGMPGLGGLLNEGHYLDAAERKLRAIYRNMAEHHAGIAHQGELDKDSLDDYNLRSLIIARQEGMSADPIVNGGIIAYDPYGFVWSPTKEKLVPEEHPEKYQKTLDGFRELMQRRNAVLDKYLGHRRCYYSSVDECHYSTNQRSYGFWNIIHELGGMTWTDYSVAYQCSVFTDVNDVPAGASHLDSAAWHRGGANAFTYAGPFCGLENPDVWRRTKGLRYWYADFDGLDEYEFCCGNRWIEFFYRGKYCPMGMVYFTMDGMLSTLSWEGVREGFDDIRYCTLVRQYAEKGMASADAATRKLAREAIVWQDGQDPEYILDLDAFRRENAKWVIRLMAKTGPLPEEKDTELPPPELPPDTRFQRIPDASVGAAAIFKYVEDTLQKECKRHDLVMPALESLIKSPDAAPADVVRASLMAADLRMEMLDRKGALKFIDDALARRDLKGADRGRLYLARVRSLTTDVKYFEVYTLAQLEETHKTLVSAMKQPGVSREDRYKAIESLLSAYVYAGEVGKGAEFVDECVRDVKMDQNDLSDLYITLADGWHGVGEWQKALKAYDEAKRVSRDPQKPTFIWRTFAKEAEAAEKVKDYARASACFQRVLPLCTGDLKDQKKKYAAQVKRLQPLVNKTQKLKVGTMDSDEEIDGISLDE